MRRMGICSRLAILLAALLAACASPPGPPPPEPSAIEVRDSGVLQPEIRLSANYSRPAEAPAHLAAGLGVEIGAMRARGESGQSLPEGAGPAVYNDRTFASPQDLRYEFEFGFYDFSYRWRHYVGDGPVGIELLGGLAVADLDLTVSSAGQSSHKSLESVGIVAGLGALVRLRPGTTLQARFIRYASGPKCSDCVDAARRIEAGVAQALARNVLVRAGYASWRVQTERDGPSVSPVNVRFSGPALGLELAF
jgi:hypothetical protein